VRLYFDSTKYYIEKAKLPLPDGLHCTICGKSLPPKRRKYCSDKCFLHWYNRIARFDWPSIRKAVRRRDKYTCRDCGTKRDKYGGSPKLTVHHVVPIKDGGPEFDIGNCVTLCETCHRKRHQSMKKTLKDVEMKEMVRLDTFLE
jgi:5-methylcytosine-specific restriction endonuclease McrA